jgi:hypothetical protein
MSNLIYLFIKNIKTNKLSKKLDYKIINPFKIIKTFKNAYILNLPAHMRIHLIFHVSLL